MAKKAMEDLNAKLDKEKEESERKIAEMAAKIEQLKNGSQE